MDFYIKFSDKEMLRLPVVPSDFTIQAGNLTQNITVTNIGELSLFGPEKLRAISINSFFPYTYRASYCAYRSFPKPWDCVEKINKWRNSGQPIRLLIIDRSRDVDINMEMLIETFDTSMRDASGDVYFTIAFREYKRVNIERVKGGTETLNKRPAPPTAPAQTSTVRTYTVVSGDCLWNIAKKYYGDGSKYTTIYNANKDKIKDPALIYPGQVLVIP